LGFIHLQAAGPIGLLKEELRTGFQALWLTLKSSWGQWEFQASLRRKEKESGPRKPPREARREFQEESDERSNRKSDKSRMTGAF
jgi:hypothetical protein